MTTRVAIYARVSTSDQTTENQLVDLRRYARDRGWQVEDEYVDEGISGTRESRPALDRMMDGVKKRLVDVVLVWRFDRFARSVKHLVLALDDLRSLGVGFVSYHENVDTSSPLGQAIFTIIAAMAALERDIIIERVKAGISRARKQGKHLGRPRLDVDCHRVHVLSADGLSHRQIAARLGISHATVYRVLKNGVGGSATKSFETVNP